MLEGIDTLVFDIAGRRRPLLHLQDDDGVRDGGGGEARRSRWWCSTGRTRSTASRSRGRRSTRTLLGIVGYFPMPIRHGMTMGELARLFNAENKIGADLTVVPVRNWRREQWFDETGPAVGEPVAEHAEPERGDALPGHRRHRVREPVGRPRHRHAVRAGRRAVDRRREAGRGAERAAAARRPVLPDVVHAERRASSRASGAAASSWS